MIRTQAAISLVFIVLGWLLFYTAQAVGSMWLMFVGAILLVGAVLLDLVWDSIFHPLAIFLSFTFLVALVNLIFLFIFLGRQAFFFSYGFLVLPEHIFLLARETLIVFSMCYLVYLLVEGVGPRPLPITGRIWIHSINRLWFFPYLIGLSAIILLALTHGGFSSFSTVGGYRTQVGSGEGVFVVFQFFVLVGIFLFYKKVMLKKPYIKYGIVIFLSLPIVLSGSRTPLVIAVIGIGFLDYAYGRRIKFLYLFSFMFALLALIIVLGVLRSNRDLSFLLGMALDLSMGTGFVVGKFRDFYPNKICFQCFLLPIQTFLPDFIKQTGWWSTTPNYYFTKFLFPYSDFTASFGFMGEAAYILTWSLRWINYLLIGLFLTLSNKYCRRYFPVLGACVAGCAIRFGKGGIIGGGGYLSQMLFVLALTMCAYWFAVGVSRGRV